MAGQLKTKLEEDNGAAGASYNQQYPSMVSHYNGKAVIYSWHLCSLAASHALPVGQ